MGSCAGSTFGNSGKKQKHAQGRAYCVVFYNDNDNDTARGEPEQSGNFVTSFWTGNRFRAEFLGLGRNPWHVAHFIFTRFSRKCFE